MDTLFKHSGTFASLSLKDLAQARDLFHYQLMKLQVLARHSEGEVGER
jgi:hypothetical protein